MNSPFQPFYDEDNGLQISVYNKKTLFIRLNGTNDRDTGIIKFPLSSKSNVRFRLSVALSAGNKFGLWIHLIDPDENFLIQNCEIRRMEKLDRILLQKSVFTDSALGVCQLPADKTIHDFTIYFPFMNFEIAGLQLRADAATQKSSKRKEFNLCEIFSSSYRDMIKETSFDVGLMVDAKTIGSYKYVLCASSDVFRATFNGHTTESKTGLILIEDFEHEIVELFVESLHTHKIRFDDNPITTLKIKMLAKKYNVAAIEKAALEAFDVVNVDRNNFVSLYKLAALDDGIKKKLEQRFDDMKLELKDLLDFDQLDIMMKVEFTKQLLVIRKRKCELQDDIQPSKVNKPN